MKAVACYLPDDFIMNIGTFGKLHCTPIERMREKTANNILILS